MDSKRDSWLYAFVVYNYRSSEQMCTCRVKKNTLPMVSYTNARNTQEWNKIADYRIFCKDFFFQFDWYFQVRISNTITICFWYICIMLKLWHHTYANRNAEFSNFFVPFYFIAVMWRASANWWSAVPLSANYSVKFNQTKVKEYESKRTLRCWVI